MNAPLVLRLFLVVCPAFSETAGSQTASGYVVKIESGSVYIDLGEKAGAVVGQPFHVYTEGEDLKHPVTGQSLGKIENAVAEGRVKLALPLYSVGSMLHGGQEVTSGMRARLGAKPAATASPATASRDAARDGVASRAPRWKSPSFDFAISGMAIADFKGEGKPTLALCDKKTISLYEYPPQKTQPIAQFVHPGVGPRMISLSAADINGNGRAELFATLYNETFSRMETLIFEMVDGKWSQLADLPYMVRSYQDGGGAPVLAMQQLVEDQTFPFSNIYRVTYSDGKYTPSKDAIRFKRVDFLYDFTQASLDDSGEPAIIYQTTNNYLRVQFKKGFWKTPTAYGQTPTRLRWHGRILEFHPQMPVLYENGKAALFLPRNLSALGSLSEPFGLFNSGLIERNAWNGVSLVAEWRADLGGYTTSLALVPAQAPTDLAVAITGTAGRSAIWIFDP